jgi:hypothetical protein
MKGRRKLRAQRDQGGLGGYPPGTVDLLPMFRIASSVVTGMNTLDVSLAIILEGASC